MKLLFLRFMGLLVLPIFPFIVLYDQIQFRDCSLNDSCNVVWQAWRSAFWEKFQ